MLLSYQASQNIADLTQSYNSDIRFKYITLQDTMWDTFDTSGINWSGIVVLVYGTDE